MEITTFTLSDPDDDGDMRCNILASLVNDTESEVRLIRVGTVLLNKDGAAFVSNLENDQDVRLEPGEEYAFDPPTPWANTLYCGDSRDDVACHISAVLYSREFIRLGELEVPGRNNSAAVLTKDSGSKSIGPSIKVLVKRGTPDSDGDIRVEGRCGIVNLHDQRIDKVTLRSELIDEDDSVLETDDTSVSVDPLGENVIEFSWWGLKKSVLKAARLRFSLSVFHRVAAMKCEATSTPD